MTSIGTVLSFFPPRQKAERDWTQEELAQFYRVEAALIRSGLLIDVDRGVTDEGDPWFIFCRQDNGEVIAHFARIRDQYVVASSSFPGVARGKDFALLISEIMRASPLSLTREIQQAQDIYLHPAAMLVALLATAFMVSSEGDGHDHYASHSLGKDALRLLSLGEFAILSAVAIGTTWIEHQIDSGLKLLEPEHTSDAGGGTGDHRHAASEVIAVLQSLCKVDSDLGAHKISAETPLLSLENQHPADASIPAQALAGPTLSMHTSSIEKIFDVSAAPPNARSVADPGHGAFSSLPGPDSLAPFSTAPGPDSSTPVQSVAPESQNVIAQADHSPAVQQSIVQAPAAPVQVSAPSTSTNAYHALATDLTSSNTNVPVVSIGDLSLETSLHQVLTKLQSGGGNQQVAEGLSIVPAKTVADGHSSSSPSAFDAQADASLQGFVSNTPNFEEDLAGQHVLLVDKNPGDIANSHFGSLSWTFADGSSLTIVGIMPAAAQTGVHASG